MPRFVDTSRILQRADEAVQKGNYDYAIALFFDALRTNPDDVKARIGLRSAEKSKFERAKAGAGTAIKAGILGSPNLLAAWIDTLFKKYDAAVMQYEKYLKRCPFSGFALASLAGVLERSGREEPAIVTLEFLRQNRPKDIPTIRTLARIYARRNDIARATQRYRMILQLRPHDEEASKQIHNLAATESIQEGWETTDTFQEKIRDKEKAVRLEQSQRIVRTADEAIDAITRLKQDLREAPDKPVLWAELGDLEKRRPDYKAAIDAYSKALQLDPLNQLYVQKLMDAQVQEYDVEIEDAAGAAAAAPNDQSLKDKVAQLKAKRLEFWVSELKRRVEERPTETGIRFELGQVYFEMGKINEATAEFQRVVRDHKYKLQATTMLGKCFAKKGLDELAIEQFEKALLEANIMEDSGREIAYELGTLYEKVGNYASAENAYKKIFETDIGYRDIAEKMERVYKMRRSQK